MSLRTPTSRRLRRVALASAVVLALGGGAAIALAATGQTRPPQPPSAAPTSPVPRSHTGPPGSAGTASPAPPSKSATPPEPVSYPASTPTHLSIPTIDVNATIRKVGRDAHGAIGVPQPGPHYNDPAWYQNSPTPGQIGPAVIVGHIDSAAEGPSVFFRLGALRPGDTIAVQPAEGRRVTFRVDRVAEYPKDHFPTAQVYGATRTAQLRLITCGGSFDRQAHSYRDNIVVYASLRRGSS